MLQSPWKDSKRQRQLTGCKLCPSPAGLVEKPATLAVLGLQLTPRRLPRGQLSLTVCLQIIMLPLMIAITITARPRPHRQRQPATGGQPLVTPRSHSEKLATKLEATNNSIGDNYAHSLSWRRLLTNSGLHH